MNILVHLVSISLPPPHKLSRTHVILEGMVAIYLKQARQEMLRDTTISSTHRAAMLTFEGEELTSMLDGHIVCSQTMSEDEVTECFATLPELNVSRTRHMLLEAYRQRLEENADIEKTPAKFVSGLQTIMPVRSLYVGIKGIVHVSGVYA